MFTQGQLSLTRALVTGISQSVADTDMLVKFFFFYFFFDKLCHKVCIIVGLARGQNLKLAW